MEDTNAAPSAPPHRGGASRRPLGFCCLPFGKDLLCFGLISGAHSGSISYFSPFLFSGISPFHLLQACNQAWVGREIDRPERGPDPTDPKSAMAMQSWPARRARTFRSRPARPNAGLLLFSWISPVLCLRKTFAPSSVLPEAAIQSWSKNLFCFHFFSLFCSLS